MMSVPLFLRDQYVLQVLIMVLYFAYLASCWNIVGGFAGLFSLWTCLIHWIGGLWLNYFVSSI